MPKVTNQKHGTLTESGFVELAAMLVRLGYDVRRYKAKPEDKPNAPSKWHIEFEEQGKLYGNR